MLRFNRPAIEERIGRAAAYLGIAGGFDGFYDWVMETRAALGIPKLAQHAKRLVQQDQQILPVPVYNARPF